MKPLIIILSALLAIGTVYAYSDYESSIADDPVEESKELPFCPKTKISDNDDCMDCHAMRSDADGKPYFGLKELPLDANYNEKPHMMDIIRDGGKPVAYLQVNSTNSVFFRQTSDYLYWHPEINKLVVELHTPGGSIMDAWRSVGIIKEMQQRGILIEVRVYGIAASAGGILLVAGDIGHRFINPNAEIMLHKVWTFAMFDVKTPDTAEDQAVTLRHFQENINDFLISRSKMTKEQLSDAIFKKDFWMTGKEAVAYGLADGFIGEAP